MEQISLFAPPEAAKTREEEVQELAAGESLRIGKYTLTLNEFLLYEAESKEEHLCLGEDLESVWDWMQTIKK